MAGALVLGLLGAFLANWWAGAALLALGVVVISRPLDVFISLVLVASAAAFAEYGDPHIQRDLLIVGVLTLYALASLSAAAITGRWALPVARLTDALLALAITTAIGVVHGLAVHNSIRYIGLEIFPLFTLAFALAVGGTRFRTSDLRIAKWALIAVALASSSLGFRYYAMTGMRTQGLPFSPVPGFVAIVVLTLMLFEPSPRPRLLPVILFCVMIAHQVITFTRGFWIALLISLPVACALYVRRGEGARQRWDKVVRTLGLIALVMIPMMVFASSVVGWSEIISMIGSRFASSFETKNTPETVSNIVRLVELRTVMKSILASPLLGSGHGATLVVRQFFSPRTGAQWWVHETYVMIWFKQGILGLAALLWVLYAATRTGMEGIRNPDPKIAGWCATCAACTVFAAVVGLTNYYFFMVTLTFMLALVWGVALSFARPRKRRFVWRTTDATRPGDGV